MSSSEPAPVPSPAAWVAAHPGMASLMARLSTQPLGGTFRFEVDLDGEGHLTMQACAGGPEASLLIVRDGIGGFKMSFRNTDGNMLALPPVSAEDAVLAAFECLRARMQAQGIPWSVADFLPGGSAENEGFHPLQEPGFSFDPSTVNALRHAMRTSVEGGAVRTAPPAAVADARLRDMDVFDVRPSTRELLAAIEREETPGGDIRPLLMRQDSMDGGSHLILTSGMELDRGWLTWSAVPDGEVQREVWPKGMFEVFDAPEHLWLGREPDARTLH